MGSSVAGTVKWYDEAKGYGFITPKGGGKDIFVHAGPLARSELKVLGVGDRVVVHVGQAQFGPFAVDVARPAPTRFRGESSSHATAGTATPGKVAAIRRG